MFWLCQTPVLSWSSHSGRITLQLRDGNDQTRHSIAPLGSWYSLLLGRKCDVWLECLLAQAQSVVEHEDHWSSTYEAEIRNREKRLKLVIEFNGLVH